jgi:hypothetical protein
VAAGRLVRNAVKNGITAAVVDTEHRKRRKSVRLIIVKYRWCIYVFHLNGRLARPRRLVMDHTPRAPCRWVHKTTILGRLAACEQCY